MKTLKKPNETILTERDPQGSKTKRVKIHPKEDIRVIVGRDVKIRFGHSSLSLAKREVRWLIKNLHNSLVLNK